MPFTLAHPAAAVPLARPLGRFGVVSALAIGSVAPDAGYFMPLPLPRAGSHSLPGLFLFCLPVGLAGYLVFHVLLKHPLAALTPGFVQARLAFAAGPAGRLPPAPWSGVLLSLLAGAATHLVWDSFTHFGTPLAAALPVLRTRVFFAFGHPVYLCQLLQHVSTVLGVALLVRWTWRWLREAPVQRLMPAPALSLGTRCAVLAPALLLSGAATFGTAAGVAERVPTLWHLESLARSAAVSGMSVLGLCLLVFAILWHARLIPPRARA